ncbi:MAG: hypothetical protein H6718_24150 [Polyangiaceae bacterium]|nr:hypothetical protein [Myxococcales bacterium]MCB9588523.1 hypothetical protein [Polyangiaceae bacterium]
MQRALRPLLTLWAFVFPLCLSLSYVWHAREQTSSGPCLVTKEIRLQGGNLSVFNVCWSRGWKESHAAIHGPVLGGVVEPVGYGVTVSVYWFAGCAWFSCLFIAAAREARARQRAKRRVRQTPTRASVGRSEAA